MKLSGKTILVTGAAKRLGREIALSLSVQGATILIHYRSSAKEAKSLQKEIQTLGSQAFLCPFDFGDRRSGLQKRIKSFVKGLPVAVDALVNNAAIYYPTPFGKMTEDAWDDFLTTNLKSPVLLAQEIGVQMLKRKKGSIVNIVDIAGENPFKDHLPYSVSKAGLICATKSLAKELAPHVCVNAIAPGPILEPSNGVTPALKKKIAEKTLLKRFGSAKDIADAVQYLLTADYVTGQILRVDGGKSLNSNA
jgi:pteridine reductase